MLIQDVGKRQSYPSLMAAMVDPKHSLFLVQDKTSRQQFLVETGAEVGVIRATARDTRLGQSSQHLVAANGTPITTFGKRYISANSITSGILSSQTSLDQYYVQIFCALTLFSSICVTDVWLTLRPTPPC